MGDKPAATARARDEGRRFPMAVRHGDPQNLALAELTRF